jgi:ABC-type multidrug transport system ATPase subunit
MIKDKITLQNIKNISHLSVEFTYPESNIVVVTGKNGVGKTSLVKAFHLITDPQIFQKSAGLNAVRADSHIALEIDGFKPFSFKFNENLGVLDTKDSLPDLGELDAELPIPYGNRFSQFSLIASFDSGIRNNIAASQFENADVLISFMSQVYANDKFAELKATKVNKYEFYFMLRNEDYYVREDHLSSGEFFLIQLFRLITSGAKLVLIDEFDVALDAAAQVRLYEAIKPLLIKHGTRLIVISHSLAFMNTVDDGGLYYLEENPEGTVLEQRSFGYIKSDLYGFEGYDRYILTEDPVLEGFIEYVIKAFAIVPYYQHRTIGVGGVNQLKMITKKNDSDRIFSDSKNVLCIVDGDAYPVLSQEYNGPTKISCSPVEDIEKYIYLNREALLPGVSLPSYRESDDTKKASKAYWKFLTFDNRININQIYKIVVDNKHEGAKQLANDIQSFLKKD